MAKRKTTLALDEGILRAVKIAAAREDKPEYQVVEEALRRHLGLDVFERVWDRAGDGLPEGEGLDLAYRELRASRRGARKRTTRA